MTYFCDNPTCQFHQEISQTSVSQLHFRDYGIIKRHEHGVAMHDKMLHFWLCDFCNAVIGFYREKQEELKG